jgi:hypothetical protein
LLQDVFPQRCWWGSVFLFLVLFTLLLLVFFFILFILFVLVFLFTFFVAFLFVGKVLTVVVERRCFGRRARHLHLDTRAASERWQVVICRLRWLLRDEVWRQRIVHGLRLGL